MSGAGKELRTRAAAATEPEPSRCSMALLVIVMVIASTAVAISASDDQDSAPSDMTSAALERAEAVEGTVASRAASDVPYIENLRYIAIGPSEFREEIQPLLDWKTQKGVKARYFDLNGEGGVLDISDGRDTQEKVRNFIKWMKEKNPYIQWVLIVADGDIIPPRRTFVNGSAENGADENDNFVYSDLYYAGLDGSWDLNGNSIFGEENEQDWWANVYVGRLPASNQEELRTMVEKQLSYERSPPPGAWASSMLLAGSLMDAPNDRTDFDPYKDNAYELVLRVEAELPDHVTPFHLVDYPRLDYGGYNRIFDDLNRSSFGSYYRMGFSTVLVACHGDIQGNCTNYKGDSGGNDPIWSDIDIHFDYDMAETIDNGDRLPLLYISNCDSLNFTEPNDTNMERIMRNRDGGAIAIIGATVTTFRGEYRDEGSFGNWWLAQEFFRILYDETPRPGKALYAQKQNYIDHIYMNRTYTAEDIEEFRMYYIDNLAYNLLGDPEVPIWLDEPKGLDVDHPFEYVQDNDTFLVKVKDSSSMTPVRGATVTVMDATGEEIFEVSATDSNGEARLDVHPDRLLELIVTVTADGYIPYESTSMVISLKNVGIVPPFKLFPEVPVREAPMTVQVRVENGGLVNTTNVLLMMKLTDGTDTQFADRSIDRLVPGEVRSLNLSFSPYSGRNTLSGEVVIQSGTVESTLDDNKLTMNFMANEPLMFSSSLPTPVELSEDTGLSEKIGRINLSNYLEDFDAYPRPMTAWPVVLKGQIKAEIDEDMHLDIVPMPDWFGDASVRIYASDGASTINSTIRVSVLPVPDPPEFLSVPNGLEGMEDRPLNFTVTLFDVDSSILTLSADMENVTISSSNNGTIGGFNLSLVPTAEMVGETILTLTATDDTGASEEFRMSLHIAPTNDPPVVGPAGDVKAKIGGKMTMDLELFDPDGDVEFSVYVRWEFGEYMFNTTHIEVPVKRGIDEGTYEMVVWVDDGGEGGNVSMTFNVKVSRDTEQEKGIFLIIIIAVLIGILLLYGILLRVQESKHKRVLDEVGASSSVEIKPLRPLRKKAVDNPNAIPMPPVAEEGEDTEGVIPDGVDDTEEETPYSELEAELDDVISEMFPK